MKYRILQNGDNYLPITSIKNKCNISMPLWTSLVRRNLIDFDCTSSSISIRSFSIKSRVVTAGRDALKQHSARVNLLFFDAESSRRKELVPISHLQYIPINIKCICTTYYHRNSVNSPPLFCKHISSFPCVNGLNKEQKIILELRA